MTKFEKLNGKNLPNPIPFSVSELMSQAKKKEKEKYHYLGTANSCNFYLKAISSDDNVDEAVISAQVKNGMRYFKKVVKLIMKSK